MAQLKLIRGLLNALSVAHKDKHQILFDRIKSVLTIMAKQSQIQEAEASENGQSLKQDG